MFKDCDGVVADAECSRIIGNISYQALYPMIDKYIPGFESLIKDKVLELINSNSIGLSVLRKKDLWEVSESPAITIINKCINDNKDLIEKKVIEAINNLSCDDKIAAMVSNLFEKLADQLLDLSVLVKDKGK
jgi:hypothetical protein